MPNAPHPVNFVCLSQKRSGIGIWISRWWSRSRCMPDRSQNVVDQSFRWVSWNAASDYEIWE